MQSEKCHIRRFHRANIAACTYTSRLHGQPLSHVSVIGLNVVQCMTACMFLKDRADCRVENNSGGRGLEEAGGQVGQE